MRSLFIFVVLVALCATLASCDFGPVFSCDSLIPSNLSCRLCESHGFLQFKNRSLAYVTYSPLGMAVNRPPVVVLHGGPGVSHYGYEPLKAWACDGRVVVMYDQMGCGDSDIPANISQNAPELLTVAYYVQELNEVIKQLDLAPAHLFGHSWGGMLAQEFALFNQSAVQSLVLASTLASVTEFTDSIQKNLLPTLPPLFQQIIAQGNLDDPVYQAATNYFYTLFVARINPWPDCMQTSLVKTGEQVYVGMNGPNEFTVTGTLKGWDIRSKISQITVPTLVTRGQQDEVGYDVVSSLLQVIPNSQYLECPLSGHMTFIDNSDFYIPNVLGFLEETDGLAIGN